MSLASQEFTHHNAESCEEEIADGIVGDEPLKFEESPGDSLPKRTLWRKDSLSPARPVRKDAADVD